MSNCLKALCHQCSAARRNIHMQFFCSTTMHTGSRTNYQQCPVSFSVPVPSFTESFPSPPDLVIFSSWTRSSNFSLGHQKLLPVTGMTKWTSAALHLQCVPAAGWAQVTCCPCFVEVVLDVVRLNWPGFPSFRPGHQLNHRMSCTRSKQTSTLCVKELEEATTIS